MSIPAPAFIIQGLSIREIYMAYSPDLNPTKEFFAKLIQKRRIVERRLGMLQCRGSWELGPVTTMLVSGCGGDEGTML